MPLWLIFHSPGTFEDNASKKALSADITKFYTKVGLPAFYVNVNFIKAETGNLWVGGDIPEKPFIRISVDHIGVRLPNKDESYSGTTTRIDALLKPHIADKGYDWEFHVDETDRRLWKINGMNAPPFRSEAEKVWFRENRAVEWEHKSKL